MPFVILETTSVNHELGKFFHPLWAKFRTSKNPGRFAQLGDLEKVKARLRDSLERNINWTNPDSKSETHPGGDTCLMMAILGDYRSPTKYSVIKVNVIKSKYIGSNWNFSSSWVILGWTSANRIILEQQLLSTPSINESPDLPLLRNKSNIYWEIYFGQTKGNTDDRKRQILIENCQK